MKNKLIKYFVVGVEVLIGYGTIAVSVASAATGSITIESPFTGTIIDVLDRIIGFLFAVGIPITVIMILYGAFQMLTAGAKPEQFKKGGATLMYAVIGLIILLLSRGIISIVQQLIKG
ncbi:MAG: hypothetical protein Q8L47_03640 [bacterium]|nr:hypothetical protein [bacterium]